MTVYLIHFDRPLAHAQHYVGYTKNLRRRLREHSRGRFSPLMAAVNQAGIPWVVARVWAAGDRELERKIKASHHTARFCPLCDPDLVVQPAAKAILDLQYWRMPGNILPDSTRNNLSPAQGIPATGEVVPRGGGCRFRRERCDRIGRAAYHGEYPHRD